MKAPSFSAAAISPQMAEISALLAAQLADDTPDCTCGEECCTLEEAGLEEDGAQPLFGNDFNLAAEWNSNGGVFEQVEWATDGEDSRYETN